MGLNLSNLQITRELNVNEDEVRVVASTLREGLVARAPQVHLPVEIAVLRHAFGGSNRGPALEGGWYSF
jgi:hypothetical protein